MYTRLALLAALLTACTPGAITTNPSQSAGTGRPGAQTVIIDVSLTLHGAQALAQGEAAGYAPLVTTVAVGNLVQFTNSDGFANTATLIPQATTFPAGSPFHASAQTQSGTLLSQPWSSGTLQNAGAQSQPILVDKPGTYLYGCFFHYGSPMRGVIVAQ
jgi:plastocyanin